MAYLYNIPQAADQLSISQGQILGNFTALGAIAGNASTSSASLNTTAGFNWVYLATQGATPPAGSAFTAGNVAMYSFTNATTGQPELYVNKRNQATVTQIPATASSLSITSAPASNAGMWTFLPSGLLLKSGSSTGVLSGLVTVTPTGGPAFTQILTVLLTPYNGTSVADLDFAVRLVDINAPTTFRVYISARSTAGAASGQTGFQFLAIGY